MEWYITEQHVPRLKLYLEGLGDLGSTLDGAARAGEGPEWVTSSMVSFCSPVPVSSLSLPAHERNRPMVNVLLKTFTKAFTCSAKCRPGPQIPKYQ